MESQINYRQALSKASALCSKAEKCKADIITFLEKTDLDGEDIERVVDFLLKERFIDEERFAGNFVHDKFYLNKWGRIKIAYALRLKKIPEEYIKLGLSQISDKEYNDTLRNLLRNKARTENRVTGPQQKSKLVTFAQSRGFETEIALHLAEEICRRANDE
jgi:regulatory protein